MRDTPGSSADVLGPEGSVARRLPNYEHRPEQLAMAAAIEQAVLDGQTMEYVWSSMAGTGDVVTAVCELLGEGDEAAVADCKEGLIQ